MRPPWRVILAWIVVVGLTGCLDSQTTQSDVSQVPPSPSDIVDTSRLSAISLSVVKVAEADSPVQVVARPDTHDLVVIERPGRVRVLTQARERYVLGDTLLDLRARVGGLEGEQGLLSATYSPDGSRLYVSYTEHAQGGRSVVEWYAVQNHAIVSVPSHPVLTLEQPFANHNGGDLVFGPDSMLYVGFGDGGGQGDPNHNGQNPATWLGSMLRLDVLGVDSGYKIPPDNPFAAPGDTRGDHAVWLWGVRNPWRFSFDRATGDLWIGDVGGSAQEEIDYLPRSDAGAGRGANLGWPIREGAGPGPTSAAAVGFVEPVVSYSHDDGISVTGGYVYRGSAIPALHGIYVCGDFGSSGLRLVSLAGDGPGVSASVIPKGEELHSVVSFAQDADAELLVVSLSGGIYRITAGG